MTLFQRFQHALLFISIVTSGSALRADTIMIPATTRGYINSRGASSFSNSEQYDAAATLDAQGRVEYRNYFLFLISTLPGPLKTATLELNSGAVQVPAPGGKTYSVTSAPLLFFSFNDLGTGNSYGSIAVQNAGAFQVVDIPLNADGLAAITSNSAVALSGRFSDLQSEDFGQEGQIPPGTIAFLGTADQPAKLILTFSDNDQASPEPVTLLLTATGFTLLAAAARRRATS
jgi:hypothetical protein